MDLNEVIPTAVGLRHVVDVQQHYVLEHHLCGKTFQHLALALCQHNPVTTPPLLL